MKKIFILTLFISLLFVLTECKEEKRTLYFYVIGQITPSESVSAEELINIEIFLGLLNDTVNVQNITSKSNPAFDKIITTPVDNEGNFSINNLDYGNYILKPESGYIFTRDTFLIVNIDGVNKREYRRAVEKISLDE